MDTYAHFVYGLTKKFPKEESFGSISQIRRASLSIILNYTEGYARKRLATQLHFYEIAYGSLKESKYLLSFAHKEHYITDTDFTLGDTMAEEIGAMLWSDIQFLENKNTA